MSELLTVAEVARTLRVHQTTCRRWVTQGTLEAIVLPRAGMRSTYRIKRATMEKLLNTKHKVVS